jgi:hypothetical protein
MRGWPLGAALWGEAPSRHLLRWLKTVVVGEVGKGAVEASGRDREGVASQPVECRKRNLDDVETRASELFLDESGGYPLTGQMVSGI